MTWQGGPSNVHAVGEVKSEKELIDEGKESTSIGACDEKAHFLKQIHRNGDSEVEDKNALGIFALNYKYSHTLNHFLFHLPEEIEQASIRVAIIPPPCSSVVTTSETVVEAPKLPNTCGNLHIVSPGSLCREGQYAIMEVELDNNDQWNVKKIENCTL